MAYGNPPFSPARITRAKIGAEILIVSIIAVLAAGISMSLSARLAPALYAEFDLYFGADINRVYDYMGGQGQIVQYRSTVHPVFTFLFFPPTRGLIGVGFSPEQAVRIVVALGAGTTTAILYITGRLIGLLRLDCLLLCAMFIASAGFVFWWSVPETFSFGGMSIALSFLVALLPSASILVWSLTGALALSITTTNWAAPLIGSFLRLGWRKMLRVALISFGLVVILSIWQRAYLPTSRFFFMPGALTGELAYVPMVSEVSPSIGLGSNLASFWLAPWVMPASALIESASPLNDTVKVPSIRPVHFAYGLPGWLALGGVLAVAVAAVDAMRRHAGLRALASVAGLFLVFQFLLHMVYGDEPFLYTAHFMPAFMIILATGFLGRLALICRIGAIVFIVLGGATNFMAFNDVNETLQQP